MEKKKSKKHPRTPDAMTAKKEKRKRIDPQLIERGGREREGAKSSIPSCLIQERKRGRDVRTARPPEEGRKKKRKEKGGIIFAAVMENGRKRGGHFDYRS